jgi:hypothetical protein
MQLEAGLKGDDNKAPRRSISSSLSTNYVRYERWVKVIGGSIFAAWAVFALVYWVAFSSPSSTALTAGHERKPGVKSNTMENGFPGETRFIVVGDYGTGDQSQVKVAEALKLHVAVLDPPPAFVISTGDQIYEHGWVASEVVRGILAA